MQSHLDCESTNSHKLTNITNTATNVVEITTIPLTIGILHPIVLTRARHLPNDKADYISDCESIDFSCYVLQENSEWLMDLGCNRHVTSHLEDYVSYQRFVKPGSAEIANKEELPILGMGIFMIKHYHTDGKHTIIKLDNLLYVPNASGCFYSTGAATQKGCEARETRLTNQIYSSDGTLLIEGTRKQATGLCYFNAQILQGSDASVPVKLSAINISQSDLWHQRLAHVNYEVIRALPTETTSGPDQKLQLPLKVCDGCEKGKSKRLPFPPSMSRAKHVLDLVHSDLDEMSSASIDVYIYTATYLNDHSRYGMMFLLKNKSEQFRAFKAYKVWAEHHTDRQLKCI